jgi:hypothetical protein
LISSRSSAVSIRSLSFRFLSGASFRATLALGFSA